MRVGDKIRFLREQEKWSQSDLALKLGCAQTTVSDYEKGISPINITIRVKLSEIFDKPQSYFEEEQNEKVAISTKRMIVEDMLDMLIARGDIKSANDLDNEDIRSLLIQFMRKDIEDKLKKQL